MPFDLDSRDADFRRYLPREDERANADPEHKHEAVEPDAPVRLVGPEREAFLSDRADPG